MFTSSSLLHRTAFHCSHPIQTVKKKQYVDMKYNYKNNHQNFETWEFVSSKITPGTVDTWEQKWLTP